MSGALDWRVLMPCVEFKFMTMLRVLVTYKCPYPLLVLRNVHVACYCLVINTEYEGLETLIDFVYLCSN